MWSPTNTPVDVMDTQRTDFDSRAPQLTAPVYTDFALYEPQIYHQAYTLLQQSAPYTAPTPTSNSHSNFRAHPRPTSSPQQQRLPSNNDSARHDSALPDSSVAVHDWQTQMYAVPYSSMGGPVIHHRQQQGIKRQRSHQRTPSASTVASTGPASPYTNVASYPHTVNTDHAPSSPAPFADQARYSTNLPTPSQTPIESALVNTASYAPQTAAHMSSAHLAMKNFGFDYHTSEDFPPDFAPSRQSMSSYGNDSPATPQSSSGDMDTKTYVQANDFRQNNPNVQLFRTESQAYQDELYNPNQVYTSAPSKSQPQQSQQSFLTPHRNLISERLQTANLARSGSPASAVSRERSPFRDNSPFAPSSTDWRGTDGKVGTAASMRQQQKDEATQAEYAQHRAPLRREPTKTISPKDALLEHTGEEQPSLFQDSLPMGYKQHHGGTEQWPNNSCLGQQSTAFHGLPATGQQNMSFRNATSADNGFSGTAFDFTSLPQSTDSIQNPFNAGNYQAAVAAAMNGKDNFTAEAAPAFPASIPSMETSISDAGLPASSQESANIPPPHRPDDTRANTGTYTCTYHGCAQRFNTHNDLQKHKRDYHRSQQKHHEGTSTSGTASTSPRSTESPDPTGNGMTSAAILARNSQAGPHKCSRINPSTGKPCNTIFSRPYDLTRHEDTIHNNRKHKVRCPYCHEEKTFSRNDALTRHMRVVHPEVETLGKRQSRRGD